jgi:hypothetical protein
MAESIVEVNRRGGLGGRWGGGGGEWEGIGEGVE